VLLFFGVCMFLESALYKMLCSAFIDQRHCYLCAWKSSCVLCCCAKVGERGERIEALLLWLGILHRKSFHHVHLSAIICRRSPPA
jgi:hypothetical protein